MSYTAEQRQEAIKAVLEGLRRGTPLTVICSGEGMPCDDTIRIWAEQDQELSRAIARARESGWDAIAQEALEIADDGTNDFVERKNKDGSTYEAFDAEHVQRSKLRVETRLKLLAKWDPKRYGEMTKIANADGSNIAPEVDETTKLTRLASIVAAVQKAADASDDAG